jgi:replicative DNA helicase
VWEWIVEHWKSYSAVPTAQALKADFPTYKLLKSDDTLLFLIDEMRVRRRYSMLQDTVFEAAELMDDRKVEEALRAMSVGMTGLQIETASNVDTNVVETWETRMAEYRELRNLEGGLRGIPCGFPSIDYALSGLQKGQLITFVGLPKSGKSTMAMVMALAAHNYGETVPLFLGFEMSNAEQEARHDAMLAKIDHHKLLTGKLTDKEMDALELALRRRKSMHPFYLSSDVSSSSTVSGVTAKLEQYHPDILIVDGVYMMVDEITGEQNTPQALTNITRSLKRMAQTANIPVVITTQALSWKVSRKKGLTSDGIGYSSSFLQDSDAVLGVESVEGAEDLKKVSVLDARSAPRMAILIRWDWSTGEFSEESEAEVGDEEEGDEVTMAKKMGYGSGP